MKTRLLLTHAAAALIAAAITWSLSALTARHPASPGAAPGAARAGATPGDHPAAATGDRRTSSLTERQAIGKKSLVNGEFVVLPDGSVKVPPALLDRLRLSFFDHDMKIVPADLALCGFTGKECEALQAVIEAERGQIREGEARGAEILSTGDQETLVRVAATAPDAAIADRVRKGVAAIVGDRYGLMASSLDNSLSQFTRPYNERIIRREEQGDGTCLYEEIELAPDRAAALGPRPSIADYRNAARGITKLVHVKDYSRYSHLLGTAP